MAKFKISANNVAGVWQSVVKLANRKCYDQLKKLKKTAGNTSSNEDEA